MFDEEKASLSALEATARGALTETQGKIVAIRAALGTIEAGPLGAFDRVAAAAGSARARLSGELGALRARIEALMPAGE